MKIGFIGLGNMGAPMVANLLKAGQTVVAFDINAKALDEVVAAGALAAHSPQQLAGQCDMVFTMLPSPRHVRQVYMGENGIFASASPGTLLVDCSTNDPQTARDLIEQAAAYELEMVDAPVGGGTIGAKAGTLTFMVGAEASLFDRIEPVLRHMGKNIIHCGGPGNGQVVKICNNLLLAISMVGTSEAMTLGVNLGADPAVLARAINSASGRCWSSDTNNPWPGLQPNAPASRNYEGGGSTEVVLKDVSFAVEAAHEVRQPLLLGAVTQQLYQTLANEGWGDKDFSSVIKLYRKD